MRYVLQLFTFLLISCQFSVQAQGSGSFGSSPTLSVRSENLLPPIDPLFPPVTYLKKIPSKTLQHRIESLVHGITMDTPPEYDYYGYEIRRYMVSIGNINIFDNKKAINGQISNIENAFIVMRYWREDLDKNIKEIEHIINEENKSSSERSHFRYKKSVVSAFMIECQQWLYHNKIWLEYLIEIDGEYRFYDPEFSFDNAKQKKKFIALYNVKEAARAEINQYMPFRMMIY